jgi:MFS transporter, DHA1 family, tetracycline resistance protein
VLPPLGRRLGFSDIQTGAILSISALLLMASAPLWGYLSERIGRRPILLTAVAGAAIAAAAFGTIVHLRLAGTLSAVLTLGLFISVRAAQSIASSGLLPAAQAYMADITTPAQRAGGMGVLGAAIGLGAILGAALAWQIAPTDPAWAFAIVAALAVTASQTSFYLPRSPSVVHATCQSTLACRPIMAWTCLTMPANPNAPADRCSTAMLRRRSDCLRNG